MKCNFAFAVLPLNVHLWESLVEILNTTDKNIIGKVASSSVAVLDLESPRVEELLHGLHQVKDHPHFQTGRLRMHKSRKKLVKK